MGKPILQFKITAATPREEIGHMQVTAYAERFVPADPANEKEVAEVRERNRLLHGNPSNSHITAFLSLYDFESTGLKVGSVLEVNVKE